MHLCCSKAEKFPLRMHLNKRTTHDLPKKATGIPKNKAYKISYFSTPEKCLIRCLPALAKGTKAGNYRTHNWLSFQPKPTLQQFQVGTNLFQLAPIPLGCNTTDTHLLAASSSQRIFCAKYVRRNKPQVVSPLCWLKAQCSRETFH